MTGWNYKNHATHVLETPGNMTGDRPSSSGIEALQELWAASVDMAHFALDEGDSAHGQSHPMQMKGKPEHGVEKLWVLKHRNIDAMPHQAGCANSVQFDERPLGKL